MSAPITSLSPAIIQAPNPASIGSAASTPASPGAFQSALSDAIGNVQHSQENSQQAIEQFLSGGKQELHQVALSAQQAALTFDMFVQVRNKMVSAYQEIMRMQL